MSKQNGWQEMVEYGIQEKKPTIIMGVTVI